LGLGHAAFKQRRAHAFLASGLSAGPVVADVIGVRAVTDNSDSSIARELAELAVQLSLAIVASVRRIARVIEIIKLFGRNDFVFDTKRCCYLIRQVTLKSRIRSAVTGHGYRSISKLLARNVRQVGAIDPARECDNNRSEASDEVSQPAFFLFNGV